MPANLRIASFFLTAAIALTVSPSLFGFNCADARSGNWSNPATWTACNNTFPHDGDTVTISHGFTITLDTNAGTAGAGIKTITLSTSNASKLITDGLSPHTITMGSTGTVCGSTVSSIVVMRGALDFSNATATNYVTIQSGNSLYPWSLYHTYYLSAGQTATVNLNYAYLVNVGTGTSNCEGIYMASDSGQQILSMNNVLINGGQGVVFSNVSAMAAGYPSVNNTTWVNRTGPWALILQCQLQKGTAWQIANNTDFAPTAATGTVDMTNNTPDNLAINGFVTYWSGAGGLMLVGPASTTAAQPSTYQYNVDIQAPAQGGTGVAFQLPSGSAAGTLIQNNMCEYIANCLYPAATTAASNWNGNWMATNAKATTVQGTIFVPKQTTTFTNNMIVFDSIPTTGSGQVLCALFYYGAVTSVANNTCSFPTVATYNYAVGFQSGDGGSLPVAAPSTFFNNIVTLGSVGYSDYGQNVYGSTGKGGVGVANNNMYGQTAGYGTYWAPVFSTTPSTNYINGPQHPSSTYGDTAYNPVYVDVTRRIFTFDALLGGPGTDLHYAQMMAARCGLTAVTGVAGGLTYDPAYAPQALYQYLTAGFAPTNVMLSGSGAKPPVIFGAW